MALPRWLRRFFSAAGNSADDTSQPSGRKSGSYPKPPSCFEDRTAPQALRDERDGVVRVAQHHAQTYELRAAICLPIQRRQQFCVVGCVVAVGARVTRRMDTGRAAQGIDRKAGIVGNGRQATGRAGGPRLDQRVFDKGAACFGRLLKVEIGLRQDLQTQRRKQCLHFGQLAAVASGKYELLQVSKAAVCAAHKSLMPASASANMASSSSRRKAWPSAVPWTSMNPPASFITTFMSVSAVLSSA